MGHLSFKGKSMDDLDVDIRRTIDDSVDETESLPFRYQNVLVEVELPL
jgi:hypothetical protein